MDGGSTDETMSIVDRYRDRITWAVSEKDRGQSHAINKGMALASGELLTWLNSDDMLEPVLWPRSWRWRLPPAVPT